jgi:hypothetical protein
VKHSFAVVDEGVDELPGANVPNANGGVTRAADDDFVVVLKAKDRPSVPSQDLHALKRAAVPDLDGVVSETGDNLVVVVLEAVDSLGVLRAAVDALEGVVPRSPVELQNLEKHDLVYIIVFKKEHTQI